MAALLMPMPKLQFFSNTGQPLDGGLLYTSQPGTFAGPGQTFPKFTYTDSTGTTANPDPVVLDGAGRANIWIEGFYNIALYSSVGVLIYTETNVSGGGGSGGVGGAASFFIDATAGPQTQDIKGLTEVYVIKTDATANTVTIIDSTPYPIPSDPLANQGEVVHLIFNAGVWYLVP
jgi:hypothetical protein